MTPSRIEPPVLSAEQIEAKAKHQIIRQKAERHHTELKKQPNKIFTVGTTTVKVKSKFITADGLLHVHLDIRGVDGTPLLPMDDGIYLFGNPPSLVHDGTHRSEVVGDRTVPTRNFKEDINAAFEQMVWNAVQNVARQNGVSV